MSLRLFDPVRRPWVIYWWAIYWANSRAGVLFPPVFGRFESGEGRFHGDDEREGQPIMVIYLRSRITPHACRWEHRFSRDGQAWETNRNMEFARR